MERAPLPAPQQHLRVVRDNDQQPPKRRVDPLAPLARRAAEGDRIALRQLLETLGPFVLRVARGMLGGHHPDAEDVAQDALIRTVRGLRRFRGECSVQYFAARVTHRAAADYWRKRRSLERGDDAVVERDNAHLGDGIENRQLATELLSQLSEVQSEALVLRAVLGYSIEEIAMETGVSVNTVKSRLRLAKQALRELRGLR
ncbi:MAG: RNA polymerase sigma factor [Myxococcota bacterium]